MRVGNNKKRDIPTQNNDGIEPQGMDGQNVFNSPNNMEEVPEDNPQQDGNIPQDGKSVYDTNFDAGVEADEDEDPKKFIQQLTGKLSTTLSSFNNENGADESLNKYVAKMIIKQAVKGMSDSFRKELIKAINTTDEDEGEKDKKEENNEKE